MTVVEGFDLKCEIEKKVVWSIEREAEECNTRNVDISSRNQEITSVNGQTEPTSAESLYTYGQTVHYLPKGIDRFFPNLKVLTVDRSNLKSLTQDDLKSLTQLVVVIFNHNDLESLDGDLFKYNPNLDRVEFSKNNLKYIGENLSNNLNDLQVINVHMNPCINEKAESFFEIPALIRKVKSQCR